MEVGDDSTAGPSQLGYYKHQTASPTVNVTRATRTSPVPTYITSVHSLRTSVRQRCACVFLVYCRNNFLAHFSTVQGTLHGTGSTINFTGLIMQSRKLKCMTLPMDTGGCFCTLETHLHLLGLLLTLKIGEKYLCNMVSCQNEPDSGGIAKYHNMRPTFVP